MRDLNCLFFLLVCTTLEPALTSGVAADSATEHREALGTGGGALTPDEAKAMLVDYFSDADANGDGRIDYTEMEHKLQDVKANKAKREEEENLGDMKKGAQSQFEAADMNIDLKLEKEEYLRYQYKLMVPYAYLEHDAAEREKMTKEQPRLLEERVDYHSFTQTYEAKLMALKFDFADDDNSGGLVFDEFFHIAHPVGSSKYEEYKSETSAHFVEEHDKDNDQLLSFAEFKNIKTIFPAETDQSIEFRTQDKNKDGKLEIGEVKQRLFPDAERRGMFDNVEDELKYVFTTIGDFEHSMDAHDMSITLSDCQSSPGFFFALLDPPLHREL